MIWSKLPASLASSSVSGRLRSAFLVTLVCSCLLIADRDDLARLYRPDERMAHLSVVAELGMARRVVGSLRAAGQCSLAEGSTSIIEPLGEVQSFPNDVVSVVLVKLRSAFRTTLGCRSPQRGSRLELILPYDSPGRVHRDSVQLVLRSNNTTSLLTAQGWIRPRKGGGYVCNDRRAKDPHRFNLQLRNDGSRGTTYRVMIVDRSGQFVTARPGEGALVTAAKARSFQGAWVIDQLSPRWYGRAATAAHFSCDGSVEKTIEEGAPTSTDCFCKMENAFYANQSNSSDRSLTCALLPGLSESGGTSGVGRVAADPTSTADCVDRRRFQTSRIDEGNAANKSSCDHKRYPAVCRFAALSSWMFPLWMPWNATGKLRVEEEGEANDKNVVLSSEFSSRGHDHNRSEGVFEMSNVCVSLGLGMSAWFGDRVVASVPQFRGKDEAHNIFSSVRREAKRYLQSIRPRSAPPTSVISADTIAIVYTVNFPTNIAHGGYNTLSMLGLLEQLRADHESETGRVPQFVIFYVMLWHNVRGESDTAQAGTYYTLFDEPVAGVFGRTRSKESAEVLHDAIHQRFRETDCGRVAELQWNGSLGELLGLEVCFRRVVLWENCHKVRSGTVGSSDNLGCSGKWDHVTAERQSFSFSMITPPTPKKRHLLDLYRRASAVCYLRQPNIPAMNSSLSVSKEVGQNARVDSWLHRDRPHIFFDMRRMDRGISSFSSVAGFLIQKISGRLTEARAAATISFAESSRGSLQWNLQRIMTSDVYIGVHGASMIHTALLPHRSIVIELVPPKFWCKAKPAHLQPSPLLTRHRVNESLRPYAHCWFVKFSWLLEDNNHWIVPVAEAGDKNGVVIGAEEVWNLIQRALAAWQETRNDARA